MSLVIDGSVALAWCLADDATEGADAVLARVSSSEALVPSHWQLEVVNGLMVAERHARVDPGDTWRLLRLLDTLPVYAEAPASAAAVRVIHRLASAHMLSAYDAAYLELALRKGCDLATMDPALAAAARKEGVNAG